jgi:hypothetical protein
MLPDTTDGELTAHELAPQHDYSGARLLDWQPLPPH